MGALIRWLRAFGAFWWDFVVGDDWRVAAGVLTAFGLAALLAHRGVPAWWVIPTVALGMLTASVMQVVRATRRKRLP